VRPNRVVTFVTDSEFERLNELAETTGKSLSALVHDLLAPSFQLLEPLGNDKRGK
jgi:hypothetical protein